MLFKGVFTALITPFREGKIDEDAFCKLIEWQVEEGVHGLVPCGTTGEVSSLTFEEYSRLAKLCIDVTNRRVPIIVGVGSNNLVETIKRAQYLESINADAILVVTPYYLKPTQKGIYEYFKIIHDNTNISIIIYNVPSRCAVDISDDNLARIILLPRVVGIKDATSNLNRPMNIKLLVKKEISLLSGEDTTALIFNIHGGCGCVSVTANVAPKLCSKMQNLFFEEKFKEAMEINNILFPLNQILFCETNPISVKYALSLLKPYISLELRLPLTSASKSTQVAVEQVVIEKQLLA
ncbi:4-hydroxy-tetrahydrodipicolinate synthase [Wolbachia endosymbiont of Pentidionis agamae]|uniref:4-hydroxy-tetrahydrodipicolinate synthase n=1 Tax=Wolbachia endosymbiont of Pentidionis agamae TaxID=3110435 RepID=UPI002FD249B1